MTIAASKPVDDPLVPAAAQSRSRHRRWPRVVLLVVLMLVAAWVWAVPPLANRLITDRLRAAGFHEVHVGQTRVGFGAVTVSMIGLGRDGAGSVDIANVVAEFAIGDLFAGRLRALTIDGPQWSLSAQH